MFTLASFPGPTQLSVAISTVLQATKSWAGPGNEASIPSKSCVGVASFPGPAQLFVACSSFTVLIATESWAGPENEAMLGRTNQHASGAHDVIAVTSPQKNDLCTEELRGRPKTLEEVSLPLRKARLGCLFA